MALLISRRLCNILLPSPRSSSLCLLSLPSTIISKPFSHFYLIHASSSSTPSHTSLKPQILEPSFIRSAPFATFSPANDNRETRTSGQIPNSIHSSLLENELRDSLRKSIDNIRCLKNALTVMGFVHIVIGAWIAAGSLPFYPSFLTQGFLASAVPLLLASKMKQYSQIMGSLDMKTEEGLFLISKLTCLADWRLYVVAFSLLGVQVGISLFMPDDLLMLLPRINVSMITMTLLPVSCVLPLHWMESVFDKLLIWQVKGKVDSMIRNSNWRERREVLKLANNCLLRLKNTLLFGCWFIVFMVTLCAFLHGYGIITFDVFE